MIRIDPDELAAAFVEQAIYIRRLELRLAELEAAAEAEDADG